MEKNLLNGKMKRAGFLAAFTGAVSAAFAWKERKSRLSSGATLTANRIFGFKAESTQKSRRPDVVSLVGELLPPACLCILL